MHRNVFNHVQRLLGRTFHALLTAVKRVDDSVSANVQLLA